MKSRHSATPSATLRCRFSHEFNQNAAILHLIELTIAGLLKRSAGKGKIIYGSFLFNLKGLFKEMIVIP